MALAREQLEEFLPPAAADAVLAADEDLLAGRRVEVSVLSCDVAAFRPRAESDPEGAVAALRVVVGELAGVVREHGGTLMSFPGDGLLAVFGAPVPTTSHRAAAEAAAGEIRGPALARLNERLEAAGAAPVELKVAVASGPATVGLIGDGRRHEYVALGEPTAAAIRATSD